MKLTNDYRKLSQVLIFLIGTLCIILCIGKLTQIEHCPDLISANERLDEFRMMTDERDQLISELIERVSSLEDDIATLSASFQELEIKENTETSAPLSSDAVEPVSERDRYISYVYEMSRRYYPEIKPEYVCAIILHESRFDPSAHNKESNAQGLTQIRPKWHSDRARRLGVEDLFKPYGNILVCFDILSEQAEKHNFEYALNLFAGGYRYADLYKSNKSPFIHQLEDIINAENFKDSVVPVDVDALLGGEIGATG